MTYGFRSSRWRRFGGRETEKPSDNPRLSMHHLADSSEIEKEADQIMMLWRDRSDPQAERSPAEINVVKNRHGNIGTVYCTWHGGTTSFLNRSAADEFGKLHDPDQGS